MWHKTVGNSIPLCLPLLLLLPLLLPLHCTASPTPHRQSAAATTTKTTTTTTTTHYTTPTTTGEVIGATSLAAASAALYAAKSASSATDKKEPSSRNESNNHSDREGDNDSDNKRNYLDDLMLTRSANLLLEDLQQPNGQLINLTRHHDGDIFRTSGISTCNADTCIGLSSGTAGLVRLGADGNDGSGQVSVAGSLAGGSNGQLELLTRRLKLQQKYAAAAAAAASAHGSELGNEEACTCRCLPYLRAYREDLGICVDDIHECSLSPFVSGSSSEKIPFVFLPLRGQIIYPSREISFPNIHTPVCAVTGAQYLSSNGWSDLRNPIDTDYPFRMFRDEGRSFLQWLGEAELRQKMQGRLIVVHLVCRDMTVALNVSQKEQLMLPKNVHSPCVAFRVNGSPVKHTHNVPEVFFQPANSTTLASISEGMTMREYVVIGICSLLLGLIYVASVFLYLFMKKRKSRGRHNSRNSLDNLGNDINYPKNDQVTYGAPFSRVGSIYSTNSLGRGNDSNARTNIGSLKEDLGIVKNNPLLQHFPQLSERDINSGFASDISNSNSECEMDDKIKTSVLVHPQLNMTNRSPKGSNGAEKASMETEDFMQENECLPAENVAVIEDMMTEEKLESLRAMVNGNVRKKLYFNPAYFEPHLLAEPPQAAVEFLQKIREVIAIAKYKMAAKRYQPSLNIIPEEAPLDTNAGQMYNVPLQKNLQAKNLGDKRNSIEKWLQSVPNTESSQSQKTLDRPEPTRSPMKGNGANRGSPRKDISPPKERPPPPPMSKARQDQDQQNSRPNNQQSSNSKTEVAQQRCVKTPDTKHPKLPASSESFSSYSAAANVYGFAGGEIYNNPKFILMDSPTPSLRSQGSSTRSKSSRKRGDVLDQFAATSTPTSLNSFDRQHYNMLRNMKPEILYDSLKHEYTTRITTLGNFPLDIPTPDYDSTIEKKIKEIYSSTQSSIPSVPTPDYSSLSRKSLKQFQPDSPIYRRKSPQYLIVDYETDSLERLEPPKRKSSHSSSSPSSDVSSQLSPSLSTALPLEEEMEISHAVYDRVNGFRKDGELKKRVVSKNAHAAQKNKEMAARIKYDTPFRGSMTIEVEHEPPSDLERTDSDQFEPDTLDRKPKKQSFCDIAAWDNHSRKGVSETYVESDYNQINSLPDLSRQTSPTPVSSKQRTASFILRSSNSFRNLREIYESPLAVHANCTCEGSPRKVKATEQTYDSEGRILTLEAKHSRRQRCTQRSPTLSVVSVARANSNKTTIRISSSGESNAEKESLKPQRESATDLKASPTCKGIYGVGKHVPPAQRQASNQPVSGPVVQNKRPLPPPPPKPASQSETLERQLHYQNERQYQNCETKLSNQEEDTFSMHSEITEITGVSDTMANSEFENSCNNTLSSAISAPNDKQKQKSEPMDHKKHFEALADKKQRFENDYDSNYNKKINSLRNDYSLTKYLNRRKSQQREEDNMENVKDVSSDAELSSSTNNNNSNNSKVIKDVDLNQFDGLSMSSRSNRSSSHLSEHTKEMYRNAGVPVGIAYPQRASNSSTTTTTTNTTNVQTVYRCEIEPAQLTAGMQIAIGLKDRAKKAKDLKNAWRKFVTMAASKFSPNQSPAPTYGNKNPTSFLEALDRDEGISSIIEDAGSVSVAQHSYGAPTSLSYYEQRIGVRPSELDSGYMSTDSTELYKRNVYDRYNFKMMAGRGQVIRVDTIEDNSEGGNEEETPNGNILDASRFEDLEHMVSPGGRATSNPGADLSDADSDKTLTRSHSHSNGLNVRGSSSTMSSYSSEDERRRGHSTCCGSSETDEETNAEDMWESGAESIETHSVLYKMIRKS